jgi:pimeloyl-ACP methyl ester carboxylesterase
MARDGDRALGLLFRDCERDADCARRFPRLRERTSALMAELAAHPRAVRYRDPLTGMERVGQVTRLALAQSLFAALYSPSTSAILPLLLEQAESGDFTGVFALGAATRAASDTVAKGLLYSVVCSEDATRIAPGELAAQARETILGAELGEAFLAPCESWPRAQVPASFFEDALSDVPALVLSGELDPVTPPSWGARVSALWKGSRHLVLPATAHLKLAAGSPAAACIVHMVAAFLDAGTPSALDTSCVGRLRRPAFFVAPAGPTMKANG